MASNHHALYTHIRAVVVLCSLSIKVPTPMATQNTINNNDVNRVENSKLSNPFDDNIANFFLQN